MPARTFLWVPAARAEMLAKAPTRGADVLFVDLEDGVAWNQKSEARQILGDWLQGGGRPADLWVRVNNHPDLIEEDVITAIQGRVRGVILPKGDSPQDVERVVDLLEGVEGRLGVTEPTGLIPIIETAASVQAAGSIAACRRVTRLAMGEADLAADLGVDVRADDSVFLPARMAVVTASAAAGIGAPIGPVDTNIHDQEGLRTSSLLLKAMGFCGRQVIHPAQIEVVRDVFTPSPDDVAEAIGLLDLAEAAARRGEGAFVDASGRMVDEAVLRGARRVVAAADEDELRTRDR